MLDFRLRSAAFKRVFVGSAFAMLTLAAFGQAPPSQSVPCSTGTSAFFGQNQSGSTTISSPFFIQLDTTINGSGCVITYARLYADNKAIQEFSLSSPSPGGTRFNQVILPDGYHNMVGVAWDQYGYSFPTPGFNLFVANEDATVYINSPQAAVPNTTDVHFDMRTRWDYTLPNGFPGNKVTHVRVYVDNQDIYDSDNNYVDFYKSFPSGGHTVVTIAWEGSGQYIKASSSFVVN